MNVSERNFLRFKGNNREKEHKRQLFFMNRKCFDKELRKTERLYNKNKLNDIENVCTDNPRAFWEHIKKLGPRKANQIPLKVYQENELVSDLNTVFETWKNDFCQLYNKPANHMLM